MVGIEPHRLPDGEGTTLAFKGIEDGANTYCGQVEMRAPPYGWLPANLCVAEGDGKLVAAPQSDKIVQSDCSVNDPTRFATPYRDADFAPRSGKDTLHGQVFLKTVGGDAKTCAENNVLLAPANAYMDELMTRERENFTAKPDPRVIGQFRQTICDAQGNFTFASVPSARWYVITSVIWGVPHIEQPGERGGPITSLIFGIAPPPETDRQEGEMLQEVTLQAGDNQAFLTDRDRR